jgi:hypothetical protein
MGYAKPALDAEIADPETGRPLSVAEAFWAGGLQVGLGAPVVLEFDPEEADLDRLTELGYEVFTSVDALRGYIERRNEVASGDRGAEPESAVAPEAVVETADEIGPTVGDQESDFAGALNDMIQRCERELGYRPRKLRVLINQLGAVGAVRRLLANRAPSDGFVLLWEKQRLDLSVEALVADRRFTHLFDSDEHATARHRLEEFGFALDDVLAIYGEDGLHDASDRYRSPHIQPGTRRTAQCGRRRAPRSRRATGSA